MRSNPNSASNVSLARRNNAPDTQNILSPFGSATGLFEDLYPLLSASPFQLMERMQQDMDRLFSQVAGFPRGGYRQNGIQQTPTTNLWAPTVDVSETDKEYRIEVDLPGVPQDAIDVRVVESTLVIRAEMRQESSSEPNNAAKEAQPTNQEQNAQRHYHYRERRWGRFERMFHLPPDADEENIAADFSSGVLALTVPKKASQSQQIQGRRIAIGSTDSAADKNPPSNTNDAANNRAGAATANATS